jgi:hypothetical protein
MRHTNPRDHLVLQSTKSMFTASWRSAVILCLRLHPIPALQVAAVDTNALPKPMIQMATGNAKREPQYDLIDPESAMSVSNNKQDIARTPFPFSLATFLSKSSAKREVSVAKLTATEHMTGAVVFHALVTRTQRRRRRSNENSKSMVGAPRCYSPQMMRGDEGYERACGNF